MQRVELRLTNQGATFSAAKEQDNEYWIAALSSAPPISILKSHCLPCLLPKTTNHYTFTLKMATAMFVETLDNSEHSMRLKAESRSYTR
jgi:hypothetical protein